jgi:hypothetical protein
MSLIVRLFEGTREGKERKWEYRINDIEIHFICIGRW